MGSRALSPNPRGASIASPKPTEKRSTSTPRATAAGASAAQQALSVGLGMRPPPSPASRNPMKMSKSPRSGSTELEAGEVADSDEEPISGSDSEDESKQRARKGDSPTATTPEPEIPAARVASPKTYGAPRNTMHDNLAGLATAAAHKVSVYQNSSSSSGSVKAPADNEDDPDAIPTKPKKASGLPPPPVEYDDDGNPIVKLEHLQADMFMEDDARETLLSDGDFVDVFNMTKAEYRQMPKWKKVLAKKRVDIKC